MIECGELHVILSTAILAPRWVSRVVSTTLFGEQPSELRLSFSTDEKARAALEEELFGKRILFSDKTVEQASTATIVAEYRSQSQSRVTSAR